MKTKEWDGSIEKGLEKTKHRTVSVMLTGQTTGIQYTRILAIRDLGVCLTTLRKLGEKRETLKEAVDVVCNRISVGEEEK